jgi:hypothetical protein
MFFIFIIISIKIKFYQPKMKQDFDTTPFDYIIKSKVIKLFTLLFAFVFFTLFNERIYKL